VVPVERGQNPPVSTRDDDIEFDFFEESATKEAPQRTLRRPLRGPGGDDGGGPRRSLRPPTGFTPLLRLIGLVAFAILVVTLLVFWVQGCRDDQKQDAYQDHMTELAAIADSSDGVGRELGELLTTPGLKQADVEQRLGGLVQQQQLNVQRAQGLDPPGPMLASHDHAVEALQFRVSGLQGMADVFEQTKDADADQATAAGRMLAAQAQRLETSDVVWSDLFRASAMAELRRQDISGVEVPESQFVQTEDLATQRVMTPIWQRVHGASTGGTPTGLHGTGLAGVRVLPAGRQLTAGTETTIQASTDLAFEVSVTDTGDAQEVGVEVQLTIPKQPQSIVKKQTIDIIDPGETKTVTFRNFPTLPFGEKVNLRIDVKPVPGERNTANNTVEFPVFFSI
jgi:CARDB